MPEGNIIPEGPQGARGAAGGQPGTLGRLRAQGGAAAHLPDGRDALRRDVRPAALVRDGEGERHSGNGRGRRHGRAAPQGHPRALEPRRDQRLDGGLQRKGPVADQAGLRISGLQILQAQDLRLAKHEHRR